MANIRPVASVELDDPAVDGRIAQGYHHYGRNWTFDEQPGSSVEPEWWLAGTEIIGAMKAVAPCAYVSWTNMILRNWNIEEDENFWALSRPAVTRPRVQFIHYTHAEAGARGTICSTGTFAPAIHMTTVRFQPVDGSSYAPQMDIHLLGNGDYLSYGLELPSPCEAIAINNAAQARPTLWSWAPGDYDNRQIVALYEGHVTSFPTMNTTAFVEQLQVEQIGDYLRVRLPNQSEDWVIPNADQPLTRGPVRVRFAGGAGMFNCHELTYLNRIYCQWLTNAAGEPVLRWDTETFEGASEANPGAIARTDHTLASWLNTTPSALTYAVGTVGVHPAGTNISGQEYSGNRVGFHFSTPAGSDSRPALMIGKEVRTAAGSQETADPTTIYPTKVTWSRNNSWRGAEFTAYYQDFEEAITVKPNARAELKICWDTGVGVPAPTTRIIGYLDGTHVARTGGTYEGHPVAVLKAKDHPMSQLAGKKFMRHMPSFELWTAQEIFEFVLGTCGVHSSMMTVDAAVTDAYTLPVNSPPWEPAWGYANDYEVIRALDKMLVEVLGLQWGWNASGYFLRPQPTWTSGDSPDWTLDYDESDTDEVTLRIVASEGTAEFRNYVMRLAGADSNTYAAVRSNPETHYDNTDPHYTGNDSWDISSGDENQTMADYMAARRLVELSRFSLMLEIENMKLDLDRDMFIEVNAGLSRVPDGSVFRVLDEHGTAEGAEVTADYTLGLEELGT